VQHFSQLGAHMLTSLYLAAAVQLKSKIVRAHAARDQKQRKRNLVK